MVRISNFIPTYLKYKYIFFFISISGRIRSRIWIRIQNFFSAEPDPYPWKKIPDPYPCFVYIQGSTWVFKLNRSYPAPLRKCLVIITQKDAILRYFTPSSYAFSFFLSLFHIFYPAPLPFIFLPSAI